MLRVWNEALAVPEVMLDDRKMCHVQAFVLQVFGISIIVVTLAQSPRTRGHSTTSIPSIPV